MLNTMTSMKNRPIRNLSKQLGTTLLEALIALVVFSVGALGVAALQTATLVRSDDVKQRSIAIWKAQELADRIKATDSVADPDGLGPEYIAEIGRDISSIGVFDLNDVFNCPAAAPTRCDDVEGTNVAVNACNTPDLLTEFDVWSVFCDPVSGLSSANIGTTDGENKLKNLDVALIQVGDEYRLYIEWLSRSTDQDEDLQATPVNVTTNLCGEDIDVDSRLGVYCLRFRS